MTSKNFFLTVFSLLLLTFIGSCNNEESLYEKTSSSSNDPVDDVITIDSLFAIENENFLSWNHEEELGSLTRTSVTPITTYGYSSYTSSGNKKVLIGRDWANTLNIPNQIYILETLTVYQNLHISGLNSNIYFVYKDSPNCGVSPNNDSNIGYSYSQERENVILVTKIIHIISDYSGRSYDKWYPCYPNELQWNYMLIQ